MLNSSIGVTITGVGKCLPKKVITNDELSTIVETTDEWITSRTGIRERRVISGDESSLSLSLGAAKEALAFSGINPLELDLIITATSLPDKLYPSNACELQRELGAKNAVGFDVVAACSGLIFAISIAQQFISSGTYKNVLIIGVDIHSRFIDWEDRSTCVLFGDAAGALVLSRVNKGGSDLLAIDINSDGDQSHQLYIPLTGVYCPLVEGNSYKKQYVNMNGKEIFKFALNKVPETIYKSLKQANMTIDDIDYLIPHQANLRIVKPIMEKLGLRDDQVIINMDRYGNTSTASIPLALAEAVAEERIKKGAKVIMVGFGAGLTWGSTIINWNAVDKRKSNNGS